MNEELHQEALSNVCALLEHIQITEEEIEEGDYDSAQAGLIDVGIYLGRLEKNLEDLMP